MDARELTEKYYKDHEKLEDLERKCSYLTMVVEKLEMKYKDLEIDVKMLQKSRG